MGRPQFIALIVVAVLGAGLLLVRYGPTDSSETASAQDAGVGEVAEAADSAADPASTPEDTATTLSEAPPVLRPVPQLENIDGWLQTDKDSLEAFNGQVRIVQFWTYGCHNCTATIPHLQDIYKTYQPEGLEIIGIHAPEFDFERDPANVAQAAKDLGVTWPIALDTEKTNFRSWQDRRFWPRTYIVDQVGNIRYDHIGEGGYDDLEETVAWLLENGP